MKFLHLWKTTSELENNIYYSFDEYIISSNLMSIEDLVKLNKVILYIILSIVFWGK